VKISRSPECGCQKLRQMIRVQIGEADFLYIGILQ